MANENFFFAQAEECRRVAQTVADKRERTDLRQLAKWYEQQARADGTMQPVSARSIADRIG